MFPSHCRHRQALEAYPTTIDEDLALLGYAAAAPRGSPARTAIQVRCFDFMHAHHTKWTPSRHAVPLLQAGSPSFRLQVCCILCVLHSCCRTTACAVSAQVRLGEKEGLDTALRWFEDRSQRLDKLEYYQVRSRICSP
jgi:hypothetical protein